MVESQYCFEIKEVGKNLDKEHQVFNLMYLIEIFKEFYPEEFKVKKAKKGRRRKYNIKELLTFIFWAKHNKRESYRDLENWYENNDETCQLVLKCKKPKKSLLNQFKNEYRDLIDKFDKFLIDFAMAIELIDGKIVYGDGTILKAWCNTFKKMYPYEIKYLKEFLNKNVSNTELWTKLKRYFINEDENLKEELQDILREFEYNLNSSGIHLLKLSLISSKSFEKVMERIKLMEENITGENSISINDPESRHMVDKKGKMGLNYNYQTVTDNKYGFRLVHYITNNTNDEKEIKRLVDMTAERIHTDEFTICVDNGYWNPDLLKEISKGKTIVVIPDDADASRKKEKIQKQNRSGKRQEQVNQEKKTKNEGKNKPKRINKYKFKYDGKTDTFECPKTKKIFKVVDIVTINGVEKKKYTCDYCIPCEFKSECTSQHRRIFYEHYDADIEEIRRYYYSDEGQEIYFQRGHFAETGFAILTEARNFRGIKTKGLQKANDELTISEIYHNLIKLHKHTTNKFLKLILNIVKKSDETEKIDFSCIKKFQGKFIVQKDVITGIREHKHSKN